MKNHPFDVKYIYIYIYIYLHNQSIIVDKIWNCVVKRRSILKIPIISILKSLESIIISSTEFKFGAGLSLIATCLHLKSNAPVNTKPNLCLLNLQFSSQKSHHSKSLQSLTHYFPWKNWNLCTSWSSSEISWFMELMEYSI